MASIIVTDGPEKGKKFLIGQANLVMIGRDQGCTIQILDARMSRFHMQIKRLSSDSSHAAIDFESSNGVFVNGQRITAETPLASNDVIQIGESTLVYSVEDDPKLAPNEELALRRRQGLITTQIPGSSPPS